MAGADAGAHYTAADLAKEIKGVLERLDRRAGPPDLNELHDQVRRLQDARHGSAQELGQKVHSVSQHFDETRVQRQRAREALTNYAGARFPEALPTGGGGKLEAIRAALSILRPKAHVREEHEDEYRRIAREIRSAGPSGESFWDRVRRWWAAFQDWLDAKLDGLSEALNGDRYGLRRWLLAHRKQIDAIFTGFAVVSPLIITPVLIALTGGTALPAWLAVQVGVAAAKAAWTIVKGDAKNNFQVDRFVIKKALLVFVSTTIGIFAGLVPKEALGATLTVKLGSAMAKAAIGIVLGRGKGESTRKHIKRQLIDAAIDSLGSLSEFFGKKYPDHKKAVEVGKAAAGFALNLIRGPDAGKRWAKHAVKQTFLTAVESVGIFDEDILKHYELPEELGGILTMWVDKSLAKDLYAYAEPRAKRAEATREIRGAPRHGAREKWRKAQEGPVRSWLLDHGEKIESGIFRLETIKRFYGPEISKIALGLNEVTGGLAMPVWIGIEVGVVATNTAWRILRGDRNGRMTPKLKKRQMFWAGVEALGICADYMDPDSTGYKVLRFADDARFVGEFVGYGRRYIFDGRTDSVP